MPAKYGRIVCLMGKYIAGQTRNLLTNIFYISENMWYYVSMKNQTIDQAKNYRIDSFKKLSEGGQYET